VLSGPALSARILPNTALDAAAGSPSLAKASATLVANISGAGTGLPGPSSLPTPVPPLFGFTEAVIASCCAFTAASLCRFASSNRRFISALNGSFANSVSIAEIPLSICSTLFFVLFCSVARLSSSISWLDIGKVVPDNPQGWASQRQKKQDLFSALEEHKTRSEQ
jgi:hypothetical protein